MPQPYLLLLPGMTLNGTIFPEFPFPSGAIDFNDEPPPGSGGEDPMTPYVRELDRRIASVDAWSRASTRLVVAHSFGGMLALKWMLDGGERAKDVNGLVLIGTTAGPMYDTVQLKLGRFGDREYRIGLNQLIKIWNQPFVTRAVKRVMTGGTLDVEQVDFRQVENPTDLRIDFAGWKNTAWQAMRAYRAAMFGYDVRSQLPSLGTATIVLHGAEDSLFPPAVGKDLAKSLPQGEFRLIPGARHVLSLTHGDAVRRAIEDLLDRIGGVRGGASPAATT